MKKIEYDKKKHEQEKKEAKIREVENKARADYLDGLKKNPEFQKYVVDEIIRKNIDELNRIDRIERLGIDLGKKEELADVIVQAVMARKQMQAILSELI